MDRLLLTLGTLASCGIGCALMAQGWRSRLARQRDLPALPVSEVFVPRQDVVGASVEQALAGNVVRTGMLVLTWRLGDREVATAFRAAHPAAHRTFCTALEAA
jgi:hypothetical protein